MQEKTLNTVTIMRVGRTIKAVAFFVVTATFSVAQETEGFAPNNGDHEIRNTDHV
jgi:hypothetical protein